MKKIKVILLGFASLMGLGSCNGNSSDSAAKSVGDSDWVYYAEDLHCKLSLDYTNRVWETDGIEQVTLYKSIDGDTAHFNTSSGSTLKARFYGIDTPESTGDIQPYGKQAKWYTADILEEANENGTIVVSSPSSEYGAPSHDSTGERYVSLIWYSLTEKNASYDQLILLNLQIVEYGYSWVKNVADVPDFAETFYAAESQAKDYALKLFSGEADPYYNYGGYEDVSLLDIKNATLDKEMGRTETNAYDNANVRIQGAVAGFSNNILYLQDFCFYTDDDGNPIYKDGTENPDKVIEQFVTGEYCGANIFVGMNAIDEKFTTIGNYVQVSCTGADSENYGFQFSGGSFKTISYDENDAQVIYTADEVPSEHALKTFELTSDELDAALSSTDEATKYQYFNCRVSIIDEDGIEVTGGYDGSSAITLYTEKSSIQTYHTFSYKPYGTGTSTQWKSYTYFVGHRFQFTGVIALYHTSSGNLRQTFYIGRQADIVWVDTDAAE